MSIKITQQQQGKISLEIDNGDLKALEEVIEKFDFKNEEAVLRYALYALLRSDIGGLLVEEDGKMFRLEPTSKVIKPPSDVAKE
jgi:predicted metalloprotease